MPHYRYSGSCLSEDEVRKQGKNDQISIMLEWFNYHFNDTQHLMPRTEEGEHIYIYGGPFEPHGVLEEEFDGIVSKNAIDTLADRLNVLEWGPTSYGDYYDYNSIYSPKKEFTETIESIETLLSANPDAAASMYRLLYANIIIAIEVYLSDTFINKVIYDDFAIRRFVETTQVFENEKITISAIYENMDGMKNRVNIYLTMFLWHRLKQIKKMYKNTLDIEFSANTQKIIRAVSIRHDIIHRNGRTKKGKYLKINKTEIEYLIKEAKKFVDYIEGQM